MYTSFAEVYDSLMGDVDYRAWAASYARMLAERGIPAGRVCECACGTGNLTIPLQQLGYTMTGADLSQDMLWQASQKAREAGLPIPFIRQDMRALHLHRQMDAVLATCDGVNYLLTDADALAFFQAAWHAIRPGGALIFDVSTPYKLQNTLGDELLWEDTPDVTYIWQNGWNARTSTVSMRLCIFHRQEGGLYKRIDEEQRQRGYTMQELDLLLRQAGFADICFYSNNPPAAAHERDQRWHVAAIRPGEPQG